ARIDWRCTAPAAPDQGCQDAVFRKPVRGGIRAMLLRHAARPERARLYLRVLGRCLGLGRSRLRDVARFARTLTWLARFGSARRWLRRERVLGVRVPRVRLLDGRGLRLLRS